jgi:hypothetical protein
LRVAFGLGAIQVAVTLGWMAYAYFSRESSTTSG